MPDRMVIVGIIGHLRKYVGRTPWSAAGPLAGFLRGTTKAGNEEGHRQECLWYKADESAGFCVFAFELDRVCGRQHRVQPRHSPDPLR